MNAAQAQRFRNKTSPFQLQVKSIAPDRYAITATVNHTEITTVSQLPYSKNELREYQSLLNQTNPATSILDSQYRIKQLSQRLFDFLIGQQGKVNNLYNETLKKLDERLPISITIENTPRLSELPWELMCDANGDYLGLSQRTPIARSFLGSQLYAPTPVKLPLKVLVVIAAPSNYSIVDANTEWTVLNKCVDDLKLSGHLALERLSPPTSPALRRQIRTYDYDIIHFISPLYFDEATAEASIVMEDKGSPSGSQHLKISQFADELGKTTTVRLVIFNLHNALSKGLVSIGQHLLERTSVAGIGYRAMNPTVGQLFITRLYHELCAFQTLDVAVTLARQQLADNFNTVEWARPMLFSQAPQGHLFRLYQL